MGDTKNPNNRDISQWSPWSVYTRYGSGAFWASRRFDLEDPYNYEKNESIHEALMFLENEINDALNDLLPSEGYYYVGYHEYDGSYCLFYEEEVEQV